MDAGVYNFTLLQGSKFARRFTFSIGGTPVDLTGYTARVQIRAKDSPAADEIASYSTAPGEGLTLGGVAGTIDWTVKATDTDDLDWSGKAYWELKLVPPTGEDDAFRLLEGTVRINRQVTV